MVMCNVIEDKSLQTLFSGFKFGYLCILRSSKLDTVEPRYNEVGYNKILL